MGQDHPLSKARWIAAAGVSPIITRLFRASEVGQARLFVTGLGYLDQRPACDGGAVFAPGDGL